GAAGGAGADARDPGARAARREARAVARRRGGAGAAGADPPHGARLRGAGRGTDARRSHRAARGGGGRRPRGGRRVSALGLRGREKPQGPVGLRRDAEAIASALPPLLTEAEMLAATVSMGVHGRRRAGAGEDFWQYRQAMPGDTMSQIDWRRSARSDAFYIRQMEWESAQSVSIWVDDARAMDYRGAETPQTKRERASLLALALAVLLVKGGERVSLMGTGAAAPRNDRA